MASWGYFFVCIGLFAGLLYLNDIRRQRREMHEMMDRAETEFQSVGKSRVMGTINLRRAVLRKHRFVWDAGLERHYMRLRRKLGFLA